MTERIDHTGRAENAMQNGIKLRNAGIINDATFQATLAQASATLALVEQQRIANLITMAGWVADSRKEDAGFDLDQLRIGVAGEVWDGLGLS